ncbi:ABC transporter substrate-binding protein [Cohnella rhizosphaerae]|uniref:Extracellular solute-binding protein n=1 Tax=Cohnella rhizosphaerae TaxID=1457232 RepID=A0A9X4QV91_9BACL|nr:extracellular solute-binding protein [Cohnella rhizosphaerae]MDG0811287.1 extracellular solute-binding protein [Cohnella rhizosphaerae]
MIEAYEGQHPGIKIVRQSYPYDQLFDVIDVKMGTGTSDIDAFVVDEPMVAGYSQQGYLLALDDYFDASDREGMLPGSLSTGYYRDRLMAVPMNTSEQLLFYNKKLLTEAGIEWPSERIEDRLAWEDVVEMSQLLMSRLNDGTGGREPVWGLMFEQIGRPYQMLALPNSLGGRGIGDDGVTTDGIVNDEAWVRSMQFYSDLFNRYRISPKGVKAYESRNLFLSGQIAFFVGGTWDIQGFLTAEQKLDFGYAPPSVLPRRNAGHAHGGAGIWGSTCTRSIPGRRQTSSGIWPSDKARTSGSGRTAIFRPRCRCSTGF